MGSAQSAKGKWLFPLFPSSARYHRLSDACALLTQRLLQDQNSNLSMEIADQVQAYWQKSLALEKEIGGLKSNFSRLETMLQTSISKLQPTPTSVIKAIEGGDKQKAIANLEQKVDKLKKCVDGVITGREADKRVYSAAFSNQGLDIKKVEEKNLSVEKQVEELIIRVNEMTSTMVEMSAIFAELKLQPKEAPLSAEVGIPELLKITVSKDKLYIILLFLIALLIGLNL